LRGFVLLRQQLRPQRAGAGALIVAQFQLARFAQNALGLLRPILLQRQFGGIEQIWRARFQRCRMRLVEQLLHIAFGPGGAGWRRAVCQRHGQQQRTEDTERAMMARQ
jgi:hypothetical protein